MSKYRIKPYGGVKYYVQEKKLGFLWMDVSVSLSDAPEMFDTVEDAKAFIDSLIRGDYSNKDSQIIYYP